MNSNQDKDDHEEYSEHETASENEADEFEENLIYTENSVAPFVLGKDGLTKWQLHCPNLNLRVRRGRHNVLTQLAGLKNDAKNAVNIIDSSQIYTNDR